MYDENTFSPRVPLLLPCHRICARIYLLSFLFYFQVRQRGDNCGAKKKKKKGKTGVSVSEKKCTFVLPTSSCIHIFPRTSRHSLSQRIKRWRGKCFSRLLFNQQNLHRCATPLLPPTCSITTVRLFPIPFHPQLTPDVYYLLRPKRRGKLRT